jgi:hypothetical protein
LLAGGKIDAHHKRRPVGASRACEEEGEQVPEKKTLDPGFRWRCQLRKQGN